jgi:hypothetical protein
MNDDAASFRGNPNLDGWGFILMEKIHKSIRLVRGDVVKIFGSRSGLLFYGCHYIVRVQSVTRSKTLMVITGTVLSFSVPDPSWNTEDEFGSRSFTIYYRKNDIDKAFKLTDKEAEIELV